MACVKLQMQCRNIEERMGIKKKDYQRNNKTSGNRSIWKVESAKRHKNNGCANCKRFIPQKNAKKSNTQRKKNTKTVKNKS